ncbi:ABC transporter permease [Ketogulonicigenium vulgare]|uniref:Peptide ABC transporter, permease protein, putative n=1 Tax=Ketogulonicigenium vulgare (strain WSH-001) TaxID=759362 RepID=F9Y793_KETVW|nr:ABC transporter permease [Ketogulonicigenium vulgare]ADO42835.1 putative transport system permease protein [Ketogulonicigenium vulgare Y25]AEM41021.1 Peptide ABC transporter, permease protein, putative [Ketogulonicigenium vulgare WSH-001]ALJ82331.1 ABC transporter permease [Ketogulonicigenium vulgare]ANW33917.1 ABC transporter permease [Ketogulonicigenium vulgare]AOZ54748.1 transporter permease [Ketogulonicigenium vulgare]
MSDTQSQNPTRLQRIFNSDIWWSFRSSPVVIVAAIVAFALIGMAVFAPLISPYTPFIPQSNNLMDGFTPPGGDSFSGNTYLLGTDDQGRDMLSTIFYGSRVSLFVGFMATGLAMLIGISLGLIAGYRGGLVDTIIMRIADVQLSFPAILIALLIFGVAQGILPANQRNAMAVWVLILAIGLSNWAQFARTVRGSTMVESQKDYVNAARLLGRNPIAIILRHVLPNVMGPVLVIGTISLALAIIEEATLSFLGVGVPPTQPSLGTLIRIGQRFLFSGEWWILAFPALTLILLALSVNLLGDWLRDALNPRLRK